VNQSVLMSICCDAHRSGFIIVSWMLYSWENYLVLLNFVLHDSSCTCVFAQFIRLFVLFYIIHSSRVLHYSHIFGYQSYCFCKSGKKLYLHMKYCWKTGFIWHCCAQCAAFHEQFQNMNDVLPVCSFNSAVRLWV
jgi:hypothetical protein